MRCTDDSVVIADNKSVLQQLLNLVGEQSEESDLN